VNPYDVLVAGGGLTGAAMAATLAARNPALRIGVIEARPFDPKAHGEAFDPRVIALTEASRQLLEALGVWDAILARRVCPYGHMVVRDSEGTGMVSFDCTQVRRPDLGHIVENSVLLGALLDSLANTGSVDLLCPATIAHIHTRGSGVEVGLSGGEALVTSLLIAADGARSTVRDRLDLPVRRWDYGHSALVATIHTERSHHYTARQWFMATGPLAFLPLQTADGDCRYTSIVWSQERRRAEQLMALDDSAFCRELTFASEGELGAVLSVSRRYGFPLVQQHALDYVAPGIALIGDAAHSVHPLAGQGANLGFGDVAVLAEEIDRGLSRGLSPGDPSVLRRYQRRRKPENLAMMAAMEGFKRLFEVRSPGLRVLRNAGMSGLEALAPIKRRLVRRAMGF
jgi:2-octaprenylphenol hydroxylase